MKGSKKRLGILGGISAASTQKYYQKLTDLYYSLEKDYYYPEILINSLDFQYFTDLENEKRTTEYIQYIVSSIHQLQKAGADVIIMAANSPHSVYDEVKTRVQVPIISIVETTAQKAKELNLKKVLLTGIKYTMQSDFYQRKFKTYGIDVIVPDEQEQIQIDEIIFKELAIGKFLQSSRESILKIINGKNVDGVILGCTELPLLIKQENCRIPILDTLTLHVEKTLYNLLCKLKER
ncbi:aspartate/glutamate racemase family protein [Sporolactobacillus laevolacticus]|uniref:Aspartate racemase n=1 Tax=Sporolactobacillus laevolacticus DSM 442 TaxID=1395513 RepID=V6ITR4_9BACL|nr:amino acid racemase [Sporolactobacillus laevolacticus]EST10238.1 aspartate racemase [Sporolactobacillus laevolacticus DSM 442]